MIDGSLKEMMVRISDEGDLLPNTIYVPQHFHSKGINDQLALGPVNAMAHYLTTHSWVMERLDAVFFNPESVLLEHLVEEKVGIALVDIPYALMRHHQMRTSLAEQFMRDQHHVWWSRTDRLPLLQDISAFFQDKLEGMRALMRGDLPAVLYLPAPQGGVVQPESLSSEAERAGKGEGGADGGSGSDVRAGSLGNGELASTGSRIPSSEASSGEKRAEGQIAWEACRNQI
jgi:hypothetical protein